MKKTILKEITPREDRYEHHGMKCPAIFKDITPETMKCVIGACPKIYKTKNVTPKNMKCGIGACPEIHQAEESYFIIGEKVNPADFGLNEKVGDNEVLVKVPKKLIDKKEE